MIETTFFKSTGHHLRWRTNSRVTIVGFHPSNMFTWHLMWRSTKGNFVLFSKLFLYFKLVAFHFHTISIFFYLCPNWTWNFVAKLFCYRSFHIITGHRTEKVLLMKFEILGLAAASSSLDSWNCLSLENDVKVVLRPKNNSFFFGF